MLKRVRFRSTLVDLVRSCQRHPQTPPSIDADSVAGDGRRRPIRFRLTGLWRDRDFLRFWAADAVSETGSQITVLALPLLAALALNASPLQMGLLTAAGTAPNLIFGLVAGVWVDRVRRRRLMIAADFIRVALLLTIPVAWILGDVRIELLYLVTFLNGAMKVFFDVAWMSYLPELVGRENLLDGNSKLHSTASLAQVVGPGLAGVLVGVFGAANAIVLDALSFLASALFLRHIGVAEAEPALTTRHPPVFRSIRQGFRLAIGNKILRAMFFSAAMTAFFGDVFLAVYVLYMVNVLGLSAGMVGLVFGLGGLGALIGATLAGPVARRMGVGPAVIVGRVLFGLCGAPVPLAVLVPSLALPLVMTAEFLQWMMLLIAEVNSLSLRQAITPDRYLGRINATSKFLVGGALPLGALLGGALGELIGLKATLLVGIAGFMLAASWVYFSPLRDLQEQPQPLEIDEPLVAD